MSIKHAKALYSRLIADENFRQKIEQAFSYEERYQILQDAGFACTSLELKIAKNELLQSSLKNRELNSIEEAKIVGGVNLSQLQLDQFDRYLFNEKDL